MKNLSKKAIIIITVCTLILVVGIVFTIFQTHILCFHKWSAATCTEAKKCIVCGDAAGEPLGHDCTNWTILKEPSCSELGIKDAACNRCEAVVKKEIDKLPHTDGAWVVTKDFVINKDSSVTPGIETLHCAICDTGFKTREYTVKLTTGQRNALMSARDEIDFWHPSYDYLIELLCSSGFEVNDAKFAADHCGADWDEQCLLLAKREMANGKSKAGIISWLRYQRFSEAQINKAMAELNY